MGAIGRMALFGAITRKDRFNLQLAAYGRVCLTSSLALHSPSLIRILNYVSVFKPVSI